MKKAVKKKKPKTITLDGAMVSALRRLWGWSPERYAALRRDNSSCQICGLKASRAKGKEVKVEVHHIKPDGINWQRIIRVLREELFCNPNMLITLCKEHHLEVHRTGEL